MSSSGMSFNSFRGQKLNAYKVDLPKQLDGHRMKVNKSVDVFEETFDKNGYMYRDKTSQIEKIKSLDEIL